MSGEREVFMESEVEFHKGDSIENQQLSDEEEAQNEEYEVSERKYFLLGVVYHLRLLMFFILKGLANYYSFSIGTKMKNAEKFNVVIFRINKESPSGGFSYRLFQAKNEGGESSKNITNEELLSGNLSDDFSLRAYLESYLKLRPEFTSGEDDIKDLVICTNGRFNLEDSFGDITHGKALEETEDVDEIFQTKLLRFSAEGRRVSKEFLKKTLKGKTQMEAYIDCFLDELHFAVYKYGNEDLEKENRRLLRNACRICNMQFAYPAFEKYIQDWMTDSKEFYLSDVKIRKFLLSLNDKLGVLKFGFHDPVQNFIGRTQELEEIERVWKSELNNIIVISGLEGMGKSELAREFIYNNSGVFKRIVWITGDTESSLINSFEDLTKILEIDIKDKEMNTLVKEIYSHFGSKDSIFVFDNVDQYDILTDLTQYLRKLFPNNKNSPLIIITSRVQRYWKDVTNISLKELDQDDAKMFIKWNIPSSCHSTKDSIEKMAKQLQYFPLALQLAVAFIKRMRSLSYGKPYSIEDILKSFEKDAGHILSSKIIGSSGQDYEKTTMTTWTITFKAIEEEDKKAADILNIISHFTPHNINSRNIYLYFDSIGEEQVNKSLILLKNYSVIEVNDKIHIHRLVQKLILLKLKEKGEDEKTLRLVLKPILKIDLEQKISVWERLDGYKDIQQEYAHLPVLIMQSLIDSFRYEEACIYGRTFVNVLNEICEATDANLLNAMQEFKYASLKTCLVKEALTMHDDIIKRVINMIDDKSEALMLFEDITEKEKEILGQNHESTLATTFEIAMRYSDLGNNRIAFTLLEEITEKEKEILGQNHESTLATTFEIAMRYSDLGNNRRALMLFEEIYKKERDTLGENHESTLRTEFQIAMRHSDLGDKRKALTLLEEIHEKQKDILGENHESTFVTKFSIAMCYSDLGDKRKALKLLEEHHEKGKDIFGENQESTLITKFQIAMLHSDLGEKRRALTLLEEVHEKQIGRHGENHESTLVTKLQIAMRHSELGENRKALTLIEKIHQRERGSMLNRYG